MRRLLLGSALLLLATACRPDDVDDTGAGGSRADGGGDGGAAADGGTGGDAGGGDAGGGDAGGGDGGATTGACADSALADAWLSDGDDISPLFQSATFDYQSIVATFSADCSYVVLATTAAGDSYEITGTWSADDSTDPGSIVQTQAQPYEATARGIWRVQGDTLSFEVVQTDPDYGFTAPTPATGFGSTAGQGLAAGDNTQTYVRQ